MTGTDSRPLRLGKIGYLNVLPIYYPLEQGILEHPFEIRSGPPACLNSLMSAGELDLSAVSSIEYARNHARYYLVPDLAIGSRGPVQSVLLLSRRPLPQLEGASILISSQTHTSAALLRMLLSRHLGLRARLETGDVTRSLRDNRLPDAFLAIGDEALRLRHHPRYPYSLDLGHAWMEWTGLPFIFGVWVVSRRSAETRGGELRRGCRTLLAAKDWGVRNIAFFARLIASRGILDEPRLRSYFEGLVYDLGPRQRQGLSAFYEHLFREGEIGEIPSLTFLE
jgi:chorismate dehydratase